MGNLMIREGSGLSNSSAYLIPFPTLTMLTYNDRMSKKVLVVDDDVDILEGIALILEIEGYTVSTIAKGEKTYKRVEEFQPDLVLLDIRMFGTDGRAICKRLKSQKKTKHIPVILVSADPSTKN